MDFIGLAQGNEGGVFLWTW